MNNKVLNHKTSWTLNVRAKSPIHIGKIRDEEEKSSSYVEMLRTEKGDLIIPGSSLKGVFRSYIEDLLELIQSKYDYPSSNLVDKLFGHINESGAKSKLSVDEVIVDVNNVSPIYKFVAPIDRISHVSMTVLNVQSIPRETLFSLRITLNNGDDHDFALVALLLRGIIDGDVAIGAHTTRGMGEFSVQDLEVIHSVYNQSKPEFISDDWHVSNGLIDTKYTLKSNQLASKENKLSSILWMQPFVNELEQSIKMGVSSD